MRSIQLTKQFRFETKIKHLSGLSSKLTTRSSWHCIEVEKDVLLAHATITHNLHQMGFLIAAYNMAALGNHGAHFPPLFSALPGG